ncbi:MAG: DEAD/DEAH box helicase [Deltaproteobacteria bacterium]|nr:DEAD/DEAH box helicase [Deltaproteobacteria bacterium]
MAQSQTGSGKTAVFLLTIFSRLSAAQPGDSGKPRALVMVPTRELATQVIDDCVKLCKHFPFRSVAVYGGVEYDKQIQAFKKGVDLVVATPGRMIDLYKSKTLSLDNMEIFVIDEADRMFDMGFAPDIMYIASRLPKNKPRQTMLFSATIDDNVRSLASRYMKPDPAMIEIEPDQVTVNTIDQKVIYVSNEEKLPMLMTLLKRGEVERSIIFTNMKRTAEMLGWKLAANGFPAKVLTGDVSQDRRHKIIEGMKSGDIKMLVATDVAARGLHIDDITHVINYDLPEDAASYVHRIGRTARAGKSGKAYSLVCEDHVLNLPEIEKYIERKIENEWIETSEMVKDTAPAYSYGRGVREKGFEKRDGKPGGSERGRKTFSRDGSKDRAAQPKIEKKGTQASGHGRRRFPAGEKEAGTQVKTESRSQERARSDRPRGERPRPGSRRPVERKREAAAQAVPTAVKPQLAAERSETGPKETKEKGGILIRFLKKILKKS